MEHLSREIGEPSGNEIIANGSHKSGALAYILGLDIGGTKTAAVLATAAGRVLDRFEVATRPEEGFEASFARVRAVGEEVLRRAQAAGLEISHIGVSIGGPLDVERGVIYSPPNLPGWDAVPLKELLEEHFGLPVVVEHDGMAGALAEHRFGAGRGLKHLIFLTLGTGLGAGLILNGQPYRGATGAAGSVGHVRMAQDGPVAWGKAGSWEAFSSGTGIGRLAHWRYPEKFSPHVTAKEVAERAIQHGDPAAQAVLEEAGEYLGKGLAMLVDILNPEMIILGSLAVRLGDHLLGPALRVLEREAEPSALAAVRIVPSELGERIGDLASVAGLLARLEREKEALKR